MSRPIKRLPGAFAITIAAACMLYWPSAGVAETAPTKPQWYNVEVIVFSRLNPSTSEHWPLKPGLPALNKAIAIASPGKQNKPVTVSQKKNKPKPYSELPAKAEQLQGVWRRLKRSGAYHPLLHLAWRQPVRAKAGTKPVLIELSPKYKPVTYPAPDVRMKNLPLLGIVKLSRGHPLRLHVDLVYRAPTHNPTYPAAPRTALANPKSLPSPRSMTQAAPLANYQSYRLDQSRAIDAGKVNYFDHPIFGVISLVTPRAKKTSR